MLQIVHGVSGFELFCFPFFCFSIGFFCFFGFFFWSLLCVYLFAFSFFVFLDLLLVFSILYCLATAQRPMLDPTTHWDRGALTCALFNHNDHKVTLSCEVEGRIYKLRDFPSNTKNIVDTDPCNWCGPTGVTLATGVEVIYAPSKTSCIMRKKVDGKATVTCDDGMSAKRTATSEENDKSGATYNLGDSGMQFW